YDAETLSVGALPKEAKCLECHKEAKAKGNCAMCHTDPDSPRTYARTEKGLVMSHVKHLELTQENCATCHVKLSNDHPMATTVPMASCTGCHVHEEQMAASRCDACHTDLQKFALAPITTFSHQGDFLARHATEARAKGSSCATCHEQTFCSDCHAKTVPAQP